MAVTSNSVALWEEGTEKRQWPLPTFLSGRKLSPSSCLDARYFSSSLCATGAFQAATPVLELRGSESEQVVCRFFKRNSLDSSIFSTYSIPTVFYNQKLWGFNLPGTGTLGWVSWCGAGAPRFQDILHEFLSNCSISPALLPVWMDAISLIP